MAEITNPHDRFFKELLSQPEIASDFLKNYLPAEVVAALDLSAPEPVRDAFVDHDLQQHFADLLYRVRLRQGVEAFVYVLFEHKSAPDKWVAFQLLRYLIRLWEKLLAQGADPLPPVYPIVFYHGQSRWQAKLNFRSLVAVSDDSPLLKHVPEFEYYLVDLATIDEAELKGAPYLRVGLLLFRYIFSRELKRRLPEIFNLLNAEPEQTMLGHLRTAVVYLSKATDRLTEEDIAKSLDKAFPEKGGGYMETFIDTWMRQGLEKGMQQGLQQGLVSMTLKQLQLLLGDLPETAQEQIKNMPAERLEKLGEALLNFKTMTDLENWLRQDQPVN